ncbi:MAG: IS5 family transposase [Gammaproteobacteria bacterium]|nr:IS5 family transposase [Gammaproteobacteria bacterium]MBU1733431.1 IS5 family transposase [Gammaproteobacteria bacterium]MBU1891848.1 IS5 family transposase [Gammaproteobacteria bacterium]
MKQLSFAAKEYVKKPKETRKEKFLREMEAVVPWGRLLSVIEPHYPKAGNGRRPYALSIMLRIHFMQQWFGYSDAAMEEALHDVPLLRHFAGLDAGTDSMPDETTILNFRHLLECHGLSKQLFAEVNGLLTEQGLLLREGTTVDATLIAAPPSTKNREGKRDPAMTQTRKGNQWYFGMKAHIGVDDQSGLVHTLVGTTAKDSDMSQFAGLLHGEEERVSADRGYDYPQVHGHLQQHLVEDWVARKSKPNQELDAWTRGLNHAIARIRAIGEHPFRILKRQFGYTKVRYRGLYKNTAQLYMLFALGNLFQVRRALLASGA